VTDPGTRPELDRAEVERVWASRVAEAAGERWHQRYIGRRLVAQFLDGVCVAGRPGRQPVVIDREQVRRWLIRDAAGKTPEYAAQRMAVFDRFLRALAEAGLVGADLLAEFRTGRGRPSWGALARALQAEDPEAALAGLRRPCPSPGPLAVHVRSYVGLQRALGKDYGAHAAVSQAFDRFLHDQAVPSPGAVTAALVERWAQALTCGARLRVHKVRFVRRFFDYLCGLAVVAQNPVPRMLTSPRGLPRSAFRPFIFTREQLAAILAEADRLPDHHQCRGRAAICGAMLTLLCALGLRHGEVLRLRLADIEFGRQALFIAHTKFHKSRYVPFGPKVGDRLRRYLAVRRTLLLPVREDDPLFVTKWRKPVCQDLLLAAFREILGRLAISSPPGQPPPRLHDLRHTFAVHRLLRWYRDGVDVQSRLPVLATFLGHIDPLATEVYLTITADLLREANARFHRHFGSLFEEAGHP